MNAWWQLLRPRQWTKSAVCLAGVLFSGQATHPASLAAALACVLIFCAVSSAVYVVNDLFDRERDRRHPRKKTRPVAAGTVSVGTAAIIAVVLGTAGLAGAAVLGRPVVVCVVAYGLLNLAYSAGLKHQPIVDVVCIAIGFVLRLIAGVYAVADLPTTWIMQCTFFGAVFLGFAKRRAELASGNGAGENRQRPVLQEYTVPLLDQLLGLSAMLVILSYSMFIAGAGRSPALVLTVPIVFYAVLHYQRLVVMNRQGEEPEQILLRDRRLQAAIAAWLIAYFLLWQTGTKWFR